MYIHILITILAFVGIWLGSGLAVSSVEKISHSLRVSSFAISFIILGLFTSMSELSVGVNSIMVGDPEIFVGNLLGASIVLFLLLIPLLALLGKGINISPEFQGFNLPASLLVIGLPTLLVLDGKISQIDSLVSIAMFIFLAFSIQSKKSLFDKIRSYSPRSRIGLSKELFKIAFGITIIFIASRYIVSQTEYFSHLYNISPFIISLLIISLGTNIPELSIILRSLVGGKTQVAFGDYIGSAAFNTFLLGILTLVYGGTVSLENSYLVSLVFLVIGLILFYFFARTKNTLSKLEATVLLLLYLIFVFVEFTLQNRT